MWQITHIHHTGHVFQPSFPPLGQFLNEGLAAIQQDLPTTQQGALLQGACLLKTSLPHNKTSLPHNKELFSKGACLLKTGIHTEGGEPWDLPPPNS